ncbi:MAG: hypothetical protein QW734_03940 [Candidatus Bathyarchaeia archaeon]
MTKTIYDEMRIAISILFEGVKVAENELNQIRAVKDEWFRTWDFSHAQLKRLERDESFIVEFLTETQKALTDLVDQIALILDQPR